MSLLQIALRRLGIAARLVSFFLASKRWWMVPMIILLFIFGAVVILAQISAIAPFIYTLF